MMSTDKRDTQTFSAWDGKLGSLKEGTLVDIRDVDGKWYVGHVVTINQQHVRVRYGGWDSSMDDWIPLIESAPLASPMSADSAMEMSSPAAASPAASTLDDSKRTPTSATELKSPSTASPAIRRNHAGYRLRPLFERSNRHGTRGQKREKKEGNAFEDSETQAELKSPLKSPLSSLSLSLDDDVHFNPAPSPSPASSIPLSPISERKHGEESKVDDDNEVDSSQVELLDDKEGDEEETLEPTLHRVRSMNRIYDRVAKERTALLMAFNPRLGRDSAVNHHFIQAPLFDENLFPLIFSFLDQPPCIHCHKNNETSDNPLLRPCECNQRLHKKCLQLTDDGRPPVCPKCNQMYAHRLRPPGCLDCLIRAPAQCGQWFVDRKWRLLTVFYLAFMLVLAAKPFSWQLTLALGCFSQSIVIALSCHYFKQPNPVILPGGPPGVHAIPLSSRIAQVHMLIADAALMLAFFRRADTFAADDLWSLVILFGVTQLVLALSTRHDPRSWGLLRMRFWFTGFVVWGCHSSVLAVCAYYMGQIMFFTGVFVYLKYFPWRTQVTNPADYRLWIYCLMGSPLHTLSAEEQNLIISQSVLRAQLAFSCFLVGAGVDIIRGQGNPDLSKVIIGSQVLLCVAIIFYMIQQRAKQFLRQNAVPQLIDWQPPAAGAVPPAGVPPAGAANGALANVPALGVAANNANANPNGAPGNVAIAVAPPHHAAAVAPPAGLPPVHVAIAIA
jgi:hypothetical protein